MSQQVNLYQPIFRKEKKIFSARTLAQACAILLLALGGIYAYGRWQVHQLAVQLERSRAQAQVMQNRVSEIQRLAPRRSEDPALLARNKQLAAELAQKQRVLAILADRRLGNTQGFAPYFTGLARQQLDGLWLTGLTVAGGGSRLELRGSTLHPELVPRYLQRLAQEAPFRGMAFETFEMSRAKGARHQIDFLLRTAGLDKAGKQAPGGGGTP